MTGIEGGSTLNIGGKKPIEKLKTPISNKERLIGNKKIPNKIDVLRPKVDILLLQEIQKAYPKLSKQWQDKIAGSFQKFDIKDVSSFFTATKKLNTDKLPQSLIATSLIQYSKNTTSGVLSVENYQTYLQSMIAENDRLKGLYNTFATKNDPAFADFKRFKARYKNQSQTIDQISQGKGFTNDTYLFFQYLSSTSFQTNKETILGSLSLDDRKQFNEYVKSDVRIAQIIGVESNTGLLKLETQSLVNQLEEKPKVGSFADAKNTFMKDIDKVNGPKQIVENVDATVFGKERLQGEDIKDILSTFQKKLSKSQREEMIKRYTNYLPQGISSEDMVDFCMGSTRLDDKKIGNCMSVFDRIVQDELQPKTKANIQQYVMETYFEQVASILKAGGEIVTTTETIYHSDGTIDMKYHTLHGIQGTIHISATGEVSILDLFAYRSADEKGNNQHIIEKIQDSVMDGKLPSMKDMMTRCSSDKVGLFNSWAGYFSEGNTTNEIVSKSSMIVNMLPLEEEHSRNILDISMTRILSMTQTADRIGSFVEHTYTTLGLPQNDIYTKYLKGEVPFLDNAANPSEFEGLFALRNAFKGNNTVYRFNSSLERLLSAYTNSSITKENFPFGVSNISGKETIFQFISRFCPTDKEFDIQKFEQCIQQIIAQQPDIPTSIHDFFVDKASLFPRKSLYLSRYPSEDVAAEKGKQKNDVVVSTKKDLVDLRMDVDLGVKLHNI